jgi:hypothetical protein
MLIRLMKFLGGKLSVILRICAAILGIGRRIILTVTADN